MLSLDLPLDHTVYTVSQLNTSVQQCLQQTLGDVWLQGEISNFSQPASGHWYFTLKDDYAQVRCAMFRGANRQVIFQPGQGQQVLVRATVTLYAPRGDYQLVIESMQPAGVGSLQQQFEQLKARLAAEGLFATEHKQRLPTPAHQVGVITSASGAALHDILQVLKRRDPALPIVIYPTPVQGTEAPLAIARAIALANQRAECDVLIVGRGGGSLEDLWSFNDERVARAIFASTIPIVSAVGHETDITIADLVADLRAPTPSAAAELVSRNRLELIHQLQVQQQRLTMAIDYFISNLQRRHAQWEHRLQQQHPQLRLARQQTTLLQWQRRLANAIQLSLRQQTAQYHQQQHQLASTQLYERIYQAHQQLQHQQYRLKQTMTAQLHQQQTRFTSQIARLEGVSPLATLSRGFSMVTKDEKVVTQVARLQPGDILRNRFIDGWAESQIIGLFSLKE